MPLNRVATSSLHQQNLRDISLVQTNLAKLNRQISSGLKASNYTELNGVIERVSGYETKLASIETYKANNNSIENRLNVMEESVRQLQEIATEYASLIAARRSPSADVLNFKAQAEAMLSNITQSLNVSIEGRHLFSGTKTDTPPVANPLPAITEVGVADDNYYRGDAVNLSARVSDSMEIEYGITAADQAFQDLYAAIQTGIAGDASGDESQLMESVDLINAAVDGLANVRAKIGSNVTVITTVNDQHEQLKIYWNQAVAADTETDIAEASIKLATDQTVLQATFQAFANLSRLRLTDFLN